MKQRTWWTFVAALLVAAGAQAVPFFDVQLEASAVALTSDGPPGLDEQVGGGPDAPLLAAADSVGSLDVATAGALADAALLTTSADASAVDFGSAVATARFTGSFTNAGVVSLDIVFDAFDAATGSGGALTTLFVSLVSDGQTLFEDYVNGAWQYSYLPVMGTVSTLDLTLSSEASAAFLDAGPGNASGFGWVTLAVAVPEASTWLMLIAGLGVLTALRRGRSALR